MVPEESFVDMKDVPICVSKEEFALDMGQGESFAVLKGVATLWSNLVSVTGMVLSGCKEFVVIEDVQMQLSVEGFVLVMVPRERLAIMKGVIIKPS